MDLYAVEVRTVSNNDAIYLINAPTADKAGYFVQGLEEVMNVEIVRKADNADVAFFKSNHKDPITLQ